MNKSLLLAFLYSVNAWGQMVISSSGDHMLGTNISGSTGILISASNVMLDLNQQTVSSSTNGITISAGVSNVIIKNGTVSNCLIGIVINQNCFNIQVEDLLIQNCSSQAMQIVGSAGNLIQRCSLNNIMISGCSTAAASLSCIDINFANNIRCDGVALIDNGTASTTSLNLMRIQNSQQCIFNKVQINNNTAISLQGIACGALTDSCMFRSCLILDNSATNLLYGMYFQTTTCTNTIVSNSVVSNNQSSGSFDFSGFRLEQAVQIALVECKAYSNVNSGTSAGSNSYGFFIDRATQCSTINCQAFLNRAPNNGTSNVAGGFFIGSSTGSLGVSDSGFFNNVAYGNLGFDDAHSYGFNVVGDNKNNAYVNNKAVRNGATVEKHITTGAGGVPSASVTTTTVSTLNSASSVTNLTNTIVT